MNIASSSVCVTFFGNPQTYKLAPLIKSLEGRANETFKKSSVKEFF